MSHALIHNPVRQSTEEYWNYSCRPPAALLLFKPQAVAQVHGHVPWKAHWQDHFNPYGDHFNPQGINPFTLGDQFNPYPVPHSLLSLPR